MQDQKTPLIGEAGSTELSIIKDPFQTKHVASINIHCMVWNGKGRWNAIVDFNAGLTRGSQETGSSGSFDECLQKLRAIMDEVQQK